MAGSRRHGPLKGTVTVPGDKSVSHRALLFAGLAQGTSTISGLNEGLDVRATVRCLRSLGVTVDVAGDITTVTAGGPGALHEPSAVLDAGNSGTTLRLLLGLCSGVDGVSVLTGDESLRRRPMLRVVAPLREMGASIDGRSHGDLAPLIVRGGPLSPIEKDLSIASAQVKTAILLAGLRAEGRTSVTEPGPSRDHTERMLTALGVPIERDGATVAVFGPAQPDPIEMTVPGDISSALYLLAAAIMVPGSSVTVTGVGLNPTRTGALEVLERMGATVGWDVTGMEAGEPVGTVDAAASGLRAVEISGSDLIPRLIDDLPILAVLAARAEGTTVIRDAGELRVKESDRIATIAAALTNLGVKVETFEDGLAIHGPADMTGATIDSHGDHRVALSGAVAGLIASDRVTIEGWSSADTSFPGFLDLIAKLRHR